MFTSVAYLFLYNINWCANVSVEYLNMTNMMPLVVMKMSWIRTRTLFTRVESRDKKNYKLQMIRC